eukprot:CAMPEP_0201500160 /NCGR_PEP_ID=MMETSP0151_2-20130828/80098_1 /ASSEMBLY_ACC=CAM_ASM_000257 /TAXON_ID=200890 /ORGANISM="Paramoeba atlantica, Strain 621/1 / CCAP 1560/9" /LENGTH=48 /DNA_ID= /DNA_START= /DNA_END= /DNA_ORIENTATION=
MTLEEFRIPNGSVLTLTLLPDVETKPEDMNADTNQSFEEGFADSVFSK